jgi:predicted ATP-grasp superfamily ATP-dependent carboligase
MIQASASPTPNPQEPALSSQALEIEALPQFKHGRMLIALSGWMDGGDVSTGTAAWLAEHTDAKRIGRIEPRDFYIYNMPGSMEVAAAFRPYVDIDDGVINEFEAPKAHLLASTRDELVIFRGREPNLNWEGFAECLFTLAGHANITEMYFIGSFSGAVPHTREPRMFSTVSSASMRERLDVYGLRPSQYEGPASFSTLMLAQAAERGVQMMTVVAEIPAYIQGTNPRCIESMVRKLAAILELPTPLDELRELSVAWEERVNHVLEDEEELCEHIEKLEEDYDNEIFDSQMGDLKDWLTKRGIQVD